MTFQGIRPAAYDKIEEPEIKEIIDRCIRFKKGERYSVKDLLALEFFLEENVVRVEFVKKETDIHSTDPKILLRVRVPEARAVKLKYRENEAIQFEFDIATESAESVAQDMVKSGYLLEEDQRAVAKQIRDRTSEIVKERELLKATKKPDAAPVPAVTNGTLPSHSSSVGPSQVNLGFGGHLHSGTLHVRCLGKVPYHQVCPSTIFDGAKRCSENAQSDYTEKVSSTVVALAV